MSASLIIALGLLLVALNFSVASASLIASISAAPPPQSPAQKLAERDTGVRMWDGYLGQRVSYGCIVLGMEEAETLYTWVEMGTPVSIVP